MKKLILIGTAFILITSLQSFSQQQGHLMNDAELEEAYEKATSNSDVIAYTNVLGSQGYTHVREGSVGVVRDDDGTFFINLAFDKGDNQVTSHIIYRKWSNGAEKVTFWEGRINEDGSISTTSEFLITDGQRASNVDEMTELFKVTGCIFTGCVGVIAGCRYAGPLAVKCALIGCGIVAAACIISHLMGWG